MSIATSLTRLAAARVAIVASCRAQGVDVPLNAGFEDIPGFIDMIEGGSPPVMSAPAAMTAGQWSATGGVEELSINIIELPNNGGSAITALQYRLNAGAWVTMAGLGTGVRTVTGLSAGEYDVQVRAVNAVEADPANASDVKTRTLTAAGGGGGTPGEVVFGRNTTDDADLFSGSFSQYGSFFAVDYLEYMTVDTPNVAIKPAAEWTVSLMRPDFASGIPEGATITSVVFEALVNDVWQSPTLNLHQCLRAVVSDGLVPSLAEYAPGLAWAATAGSGSGDKSPALSSALVPAVDSLVVVPSTPDVVAAVQAWSDGDRVLPFWFYLSSSGVADDSCRVYASALSLPDGNRARLRVGYTV